MADHAAQTGEGRYVAQRHQGGAVARRDAAPSKNQLRCFDTAAVILNIEIWALPITAPSLASGLI